MTIHIRSSAVTDAASLAQLLREIGYFSAFSGETLEESQARVTRHMAMCLADDSHSIFVAEGTGDEILGYISIHWLPYLIHHSLEGYISELFIRPDPHSDFTLQLTVLSFSPTIQVG